MGQDTGPYAMGGILGGIGGMKDPNQSDTATNLLK